MFGHLAKNCRNKEGRVEEKAKITSDQFKALASRVMQCEVREVRRQEVVKQQMKCFWCGKEGHRKWECLEKNEMRKKEVALRQEIWEKVKKHCGVKGLLPREVVISMKGWMTR